MKEYNYFYFGERLGIGPVNSYVCDGGQMWLWGNNSYGQLGTDNVVSYSSPVQTVCGGNDWCMFDLGTYHTAALKKDGTIWSMGLNLDGQLGDGTNITKSSPVQEYYKATGWTCCAAGYNFTIASQADNSLWGWGANASYQLGNMFNTSSQNIPVLIPLAASIGWKKVSAGKYHAAALDLDGVLYLWGGNTYGQCGTNSVENVTAPTFPYANTLDFIDVACGDYFTLGLAYDNSVWAWGRNDQGQLGNNSIGNISSPVQILSSYQIWAHVAAANNSSVAICFRQPATPTGTPNPTQSPTPTPSISPSPSPTPSGTEPTPTPSSTPTPSPTPSGTEPTPTPTPTVQAYLYTWGLNGFGQLGDNTKVSRNYPMAISTEGNWESVSGAYKFYGAIRDRKLYLWGANMYGQLAQNSVTKFSSPVQAGQDKTWTSFDLGGGSGAALQ